MNYHKRELTYLISRYPAITHTFILREVVQLRQSGLALRTISLQSPDRCAGGHTEIEKAEIASTFYVQARALHRILGDHLRLLICRPFSYLYGLLFTLRLNGGDLGNLARNLVCFVEAVIVGEWIRHNGGEHIHVHFANAGSAVALIASKMYPVDFSITVHGYDEFYGERLYRLREKIAGAKFLRCISHFCRSQLMKASPMEEWHKFEVCRLGVDPDHFLPRQSPVGPDFTIVHVGRLTAVKGAPILVDAVAALLRQGRRIHLNLVGDGADRAAVERRVAEYGIASYVTFHGSVNQDHIRELLGQANAFVLPSFAEGVPVALMEAMSMEIPCVTTPVGGIFELITSGIDGILVPASDAESLAHALKVLMDDPEYGARLGKAGRRKVLESFNLALNIERLAGIFERRLSGDTIDADTESCPEVQ
jgi:glycosyltransferase involved in cell wall biosynthesis